MPTTTDSAQYAPLLKGHWLWGSTFRFASDTLGFVTRLEREYDGIVRAPMAYRDLYFLTKPEYLEHVLRKNHRNYRKSFIYDGLRLFLGNGLVTSDGESWLRNRRLVQPAFSRGNLVHLTRKVEGIVQQYLHRLEEQGTHQVELSAFFRDLTAGMVLQALFTSRERTNLNMMELVETLRLYAYDKLANPLLPPLWVPNRRNRRFKRAVSYLNSLIYRIVDERLEERRSEKDLLQALVDIQDADTGEKLSREQIRDEVVTLYLAGQETTASALTFTLYLLHRHPEALERLRRLIDEKYSAEKLPFESLQQPDYLEWVINESMRLYPPAWAVSREAIEEDVIGGYRIPAGETVFLSIYAVHHSEKYWDQPEAFRPERFERFDMRQHTFIPFASGPRMCVGSHFAMLEMKLFLIHFLRRFNYSLPPDYKLEVRTPITMNIKGEMWMEVEQREGT